MSRYFRIFTGILLGIGFVAGTVYLFRDTFLNPLHFLENDPKFTVLKTKFLHHRDSLDELEMKIQNSPPAARDSLERKHSEILKEYRSLRNDLVVMAEEESPPSIASLRNQVTRFGKGALWLGLAIAFSILSIAIGVVAIRKTKPRRRKKRAPKSAQALEKSLQELRKISSQARSSEKSKRQDRREDPSDPSPRVASPQGDPEPTFEAKSEAEDQSGFSENDSHPETSEPQKVEKVRSFNTLTMNDEDSSLMDTPLHGDGVQQRPSAKWRSLLAEEKQHSEIAKLARRGYTSSEISRRLRISQDEVELMIRILREKRG